ncbi:hypothetical protein CBER1_11305 [Cercospora berteroae]|uniref:Uncharacterized protein n=1 Tax=Cercospora berteroae TaxID=357750 RepID=A0A2S6BZ90_9PEZI|nr:hypothetical protein CBER1_11305 [Cercospora berteroae]
MLASNTVNSSIPDVDGNALPSIDDRIQALSQELQDLILDFTLLSGVKCHNAWIIGSYKRPWQLEVNKRTRKFLLEHYYSESMFILGDNPGFWRSWLRSLPTTRASMIQHIGVHEDRPRWLEGLEGLEQGDDPSKQPEMVRWVASEHIRDLNSIAKLLKTWSIELRENVLKLAFPFVELDDTWMAKAEMQDFMELYERRLAAEAANTGT